MLIYLLHLTFLILTNLLLAAAFMLPINTTIHNHSNQMVDLYCQSIHPSPECYDEGCMMSSWPKKGIQPGDTATVDLWIFKEDTSRLVLSVLSSAQSHEVSAEQYVIDHFKAGEYQYMADLTLMHDAADNMIYANHVGPVSYSVQKQADQYYLDINILNLE